MVRGSILILCGSLLLAACQTAEHAKGPVRMSPSVKALYQQYKQLQSPFYFAVSTDGRSAG